MSAAEQVIIRALVKAANAVHDAAKEMKNSKDSSRKISKIALEIATSIDNTAAAARHRGEARDFSVSVAAALGATNDVFVQCASFMVDTTSKGAVTRYFQKGLTVDTVNGYLATIEGLRELLNIQDDECKLMLEPFAGLGIQDTCTKDHLILNITSLDAAYDGIKTMLNVMVNITDGLEWPLKAAPQTLLYILQLFENCQEVQSKVTALLHSVQTLWTVVSRVSTDGATVSPMLKKQLFGFFRRMAIQLHLVAHTGQVKRAMAVYTVDACLALVERQLSEGRQTISLALQVENHDRINETGMLVKEIHTQILATGSSSQHASSTKVFLTIPPKPIVFHGRDEFVKNTVNLLTQPGSSRIAILGAGGMGKTTLALEVLHDPCIVEHVGDFRMFQSCEALTDADSLVGKLAEQCGIPLTTQGLQGAVVAHLAKGPRVLLVIDNLETIWLVEGAPAAAVDELLGTLAQIPTISLLITCRGVVLPQLVKWTNASDSTLQPFSLEAALDTFRDRAGIQLSAADEDLAKELLRAVDMMPLAVTLLGQLAQRGTPVSELLEGWNAEHSALLQTHNTGRMNSVEVSVELSIKIVRAADPSQESLHLLSLCAMLPDGLRPDVFEKLRPQFKNIRRARGVLSSYALADLGADRVLKTLSPVRHFVFERYPPQPAHLDALYAIYFDIADRLPTGMNEEFKDLAAAAAPEMGNLASLMLTLVHQPSQQIVDAVLHYTRFRQWQQPTTVLVMALLLHVGQHPQWKAGCLNAVGHAQYDFGEFRSAIISYTAAAELYLEIGDLSHAAACKRACGETHQLLGEYSDAEARLEEARAVYIDLDNELGEASCRVYLGDLLRIKGDSAAAIEHLKAAQSIFNSWEQLFSSAQASELLGMAYLARGELDLAAAELETSRSMFTSLGHQFHIAQSTRFLGAVRRDQGELTEADKLLREAEDISVSICTRQGLVECSWEYGRLRWKQGRLEEAIVCFESAKDGYEAQGVPEGVKACVNAVQLLRREIDLRVSRVSGSS